MKTARILIGEITTAHGIKGLVKVRSYVDDESLLATAPLYTDEMADKTITLIHKNALKNDWVMQVKGIDDRNAAELLRGTKLYIDRDHLPETDDGQYYIEDLKNMKVVDANGSDIGTIIDVANFGASDLLDIRPTSGGATFYLPFTDTTILNIDFENRVVSVEIPEGLL